MDNLDKYKEYANDVISGKEVAGQLLKKACERYLSWFDRTDIEFRPEKADRFVDFCSHLKHFQGSHNGKPFLLTPCQKFIAYNIFGWYYTGTNERVTRNVYIQVARKFGKSFFIAALGLYCLVADNENGAEIDVLANSAKQARILFEMAKHGATDIDPKKKHFQKLRDAIKVPKTASIMQILASDTTNLDGFNASAFVLDEIHAMKTSELYDVLISSQGMRDNPLGICITTAGFLINGFAYTYRKGCVDILYGLTEDDSQFSFICELDEEDEWDNPKVWRKANPHIGVTVKESYIANEIKRAKANAALQKSVKTKLLNIWIPDGVDTWISDKYILKASKDIEWDFFKDRITYLGIDLSAVSDFTCATYMTKDVEQGLYYYKSKFYLPESALHDNPNAEIYQQWFHQGFICITPGNVTDYDYILKDTLELQSIGMILDSVHYDQYNATQFAINATASGLKMKPFPQSISNFNRPTKEFERLVLQEKVIIDNNPITRWCFTNAVIKHDWNNNGKPVKRGGAESMNKIDAAITHVEALGGYLNSTNAQYENADLSV